MSQVAGDFSLWTKDLSPQVYSNPDLEKSNSDSGTGKGGKRFVRVAGFGEGFKTGAKRWLPLVFLVFSFGAFRDALSQRRRRYAQSHALSFVLIGIG